MRSRSPSSTPAALTSSRRNRSFAWSFNEVGGRPQLRTHMEGSRLPLAASRNRRSLCTGGLYGMSVVKNLRRGQNCRSPLSISSDGVGMKSNKIAAILSCLALAFWILGAGAASASSNTETEQTEVAQMSAAAYPCDYSNFKCTTWKAVGSTWCRGILELMKSGSRVYSESGSQCQQVSVPTAVAVNLSRGWTSVETNNRCGLYHGSYWCWSGQVSLADSSGSQKYCSGAAVRWNGQLTPTGDVSWCRYF